MSLFLVHYLGGRCTYRNGGDVTTEIVHQVRVQLNRVGVLHFHHGPNVVRGQLDDFFYLVQGKALGFNLGVGPIRGGSTCFSLGDDTTEATR
jgi:hypothetical protein